MRSGCHGDGMLMTSRMQTDGRQLCPITQDKKVASYHSSLHTYFVMVTFLVVYLDDTILMTLTEIAFIDKVPTQQSLSNEGIWVVKVLHQY